MCKFIISVFNEIVVAYCENLIEQKHTDGKFKTATKSFLQATTIKYITRLDMFGLVVSYDIDWQKRLTRELYDSFILS